MNDTLTSKIDIIKTTLRGICIWRKLSIYFYLWQLYVLYYVLQYLFFIVSADENKLPTIAGSTVTTGEYVVTENTTITADAGKSGLIISGNVKIFISDGVTLYVVYKEKNVKTGIH